MNKMNKTNITYKIIMVGDAGSGKTCIIDRYYKGIYNVSTSSTIGVDMIKISVNVSGKNVNMIVWDTAGQERYRSIIKRYYTDAKIILLVFDITKPFYEIALDDWINNIKQQMIDSNKYIIHIVGNKCDLADVYSLNLFQIREKIKSVYGLNVYYTSAKYNTGLDQLFLDIAQSCLDFVDDGQIDTIVPKQNIKLAPESQCCV